MSDLSFAGSVANPKDYLPPAPASAGPVGPTAPATTPTVTKKDIESTVEAIANYVASRGYTFEPWQIAAFVTAVRTKPFVILAGISGTGKTRLPQLVAEATGAAHAIVPVRPDWTDSSDLLGYEQLGGSYQPGSLLRFAKQAQSEP